MKLAFSRFKRVLLANPVTHQTIDKPANTTVTYRSGFLPHVRFHRTLRQQSVERSKMMARYYQGPKINEKEAVEIAQQLLKVDTGTAGAVIKIEHARPIIYGRADDTFAGEYRVWFESVTSVSESDESDEDCIVVTCPSPDSPIVVEVNDQNGTADFFRWL